MASEKNKSSVKQLTKLISSSSQKLLAAFLNDDLKIKKEQDALRKQIHQACAQNSFVVLQINESLDPNDPFETVSGKLKLNQNNPNMIVLSDQKTRKIRMVPIEHIRKISFIQSRLSNDEARKFKTL